jgi:poly(hydroxyalkanoate) depolymerase family esterase
MVAQPGWIGGVARTGAGSRRFKLWIPRTWDENSAAPLLMLLHGCTHDAEDMAEISGMNDVADENRFLVLYPRQRRRANWLKCWNWFDPKHQARGAGEPEILAEAIEQVSRAYRVDRDRVYVAGASAGGAMASILAATYPDLFAGLAVFAGAEFKAAAGSWEGLAAMKQGGPDPIRQGQLAFEAMRPGLARKKRRRMPAIVFHGTADSRVNPAHAEQVIAQWTQTNRCLAADDRENGFALTEQVIAGQIPGGHAYQKHVYLEADGHPLLEKWLVEGLGHAWSGSPRPSRYGDPKGPSASREIWRFLCEVHAHGEAPSPSNRRSVVPGVE